MQSFSDYIDKKYRLNEGENSSFKNMHSETTKEEQEQIDIAKGRETKSIQTPVVEENQVVTKLKQKIDIIYRNYGEFGLKLVDEAIIKSCDKIKNLLSSLNTQSNETTPQQKQTTKIVKKKEKPVVKKVITVVQEEDDEEEVISDNEDQNTSTNTVANSLPNVFPNDTKQNETEEVTEIEDDDTVENEDEEETKPKKVVKKVEKKSKKTKTESKKNITDDEWCDLIYEKSLEYTKEHQVNESVLEDIPDFLGEDYSDLESSEPIQEHVIPNITKPQQSSINTDIDNITGDAMDDFADQFC